MLNLVSTSDLIQIVTTDATTTLDVTADLVDWDGTAGTPKNQHTAISGAATTTVIAAPGAATQRNIKYLGVVNTHATLPQTITVERVNAVSTKRLFPKITLLAGEGLIVNAEGTWFAFDSAGAVKAGSNFATSTDVLTATSTSRAVSPDALAGLWEKGTAVASAATVVLGDGGYFHITGTATISDIDFAIPFDGRAARLVFDGILTLTHNATTLILPGGADIITGPGDSCLVVQDASDNVKVTLFQRAGQPPLTNPSNAAVTTQQITAAATAYLTNSNIAVPPSGLRLKTVLRWKLTVTKSAAGTAANTFLVKLGTAGTTGDATILTLALPVGTGVADVAEVYIEVTIRGPLGASCIAAGCLTMVHNLQITGFATIPCVVVSAVSAGFNSATANLIAGIACTTAASTVLDFVQVDADSVNL